MKKIIAIIVGLSILLTMSSTCVYAHEQEVDVLQHLNILNGYCDGELKLEDYVSRAEFIKMIISSTKYNGETDVNAYNNSFVDLTNEHWAYKYVEVASKNKIIYGYEDGTFRANKNISFEESLAIVLRILGFGYETSELPWAEQQFSVATKVGLVNGLQCSLGDDMLRKDAAKLIGTMLLCKNSNEQYHIETLGYKLFENTKIISLDKYNNVFTNQGIFKSAYKISPELVGKEGYLILNSNEEMSLFIVIPSNTSDASNVEETYESPYTVVSKNWTSLFNGKSDFKQVIRNGKTSHVEDIEMYDILYLSSDSNTLLAYDNKFTGVYQSAGPNNDKPEEITVSGHSFKIESVVAFSKLYSGGQYKFGNSVTLLLGKDGGVVDVIDSTKTNNVGYVVDVGVKNFTISGATTKNYYITIQFPDGRNVQYITKVLYKNYKNQIVNITFDNQYAKITRPLKEYKIDGVFDVHNETFGRETISNNIQILDVYSTDPDSLSLYVNVKPERIDMVDISSKKILYCEKNDSGKITKLILENVTGDMLKYGICVEANKNYKKYQGSFSYDISGTVYSIKTTNTFYEVDKGVPALFVTSDNKSIQNMISLNEIKGHLKSITSTHIEVDDKVYPISKDLRIYVSNYYGTYLTMTLEDLISNKEKYNIYPYYDKMPQYGGTIRVLLVAEK